MGLQIWLPLNGNLENKGLSDITVTNTNATIETNGKIGSCYSFNGSNSGLLISNAPIIQEWNESTICFWLKNAPTGKTQCIINHRTVAEKGLAVFLISNKIRIDTDNSMTSFDYAYNFTDWTHIAIVSKVGKRELYVNGELTETKNVTGAVAYQSSGTYASIGGSSTNATTLTGNWLQGLLNDFRLYDEALSPMQIKLISQGLVAHYLLNNNGNGQENLLRNSYRVDGSDTQQKYGWELNGYGAPEIVNKDGFLCIHLQASCTGKSIPSIKSANKIILENGTEYTISCDLMFDKEIQIKTNTPIHYHNGSSSTTDEFNFTNANNGKGFTFKSINPTTNTIIPANTWQHYEQHIVAVSTPADSSLPYSTYRAFIYGSIRTVSETTTVNMWLKNWKIEKGVVSTSWCPNSSDEMAINLGYNNNIEYDISGYCHNGTKYNITEYITDSPRYSLATKFNGTNTYINVGRGAMVRDEITINIWAYMDDWTTFKARLISCTEGGGWNFEPSGSKIHVGMGTGVSSNTYKNTSGYILADLTSGWHMFTATYDGFTTKQYVDGVLNTSYNAYTTKTPIFYHGSNPILIGAEASSTQNPAGNYFNGYLSDVRIYATTLSESDIQSLYNNSAFIDSSGNVYSTEYTES